MSALNDLVKQIANPELRNKIQDEISKLVKQKKFGLVFEEHLPETTVLYDIPVKAGAYVSLKSKSSSMLYKVLQIVEDKAKCADTVGGGIHEFSVSELVTTAKLGEPIYPYLKKIDECCNAPDSPLWHTLIEAENYHALQLLVYLYSGKVDCIYIDPPYNTGAKDWKYNNDYVDSNDAYRHSKWLSMMKRRLELAKKLLNPKESVLIITIDEKEYLHLGCLLEDMFADANIQMISTCINPAAVARAKEFGRANEYIYFIMLGDCGPEKLELNKEWISTKGRTHTGHIRWDLLKRSGTRTKRSDSPGCFYPILAKDGIIQAIGDAIPLNVNRDTVKYPDDLDVIWPIRSNGTEGNWQLTPENLRVLWHQGFVKLGKAAGAAATVYYLKPGERQKIDSGIYSIIGKAHDGSILTSDSSDTSFKSLPNNQWKISSHDATQYGSRFIQKIFIDKRFDYPKSIYAVTDALRFFLSNKPKALILDFFAGSGTTQHAVELLNFEDNGHRRCISVTNNEISDDESKIFKKNGVKHGDPEWESHGIARYVTWPRICSSIKGVNINGAPLDGNYGCDIETYEEYEGEITDPETGKKVKKSLYLKVKQPAYTILSSLKLSDGFSTNAVFFKLGFLDKNQVALGQQLQQLTSILWLKAGAIGNCPEIENPNQDFIIFPKNKFAVLVKEKSFPEFINELNNTSEITTVYIVTDSQSGYKEMISHLPAFITNSYQLYSDYLDNFRIISGR